MFVFVTARVPVVTTHALNNRHFSQWIFPLPTLPACRRRLCVWTWQGSPEFIWCGTWVDTLHYSEAPGSCMNITQPSSCLPLCRSPSLPKRGAALIFRHHWFWRVSVNYSLDFQLHWTRHRKSESTWPPEKRTHLRTNAERHITG